MIEWEPEYIEDFWAYIRTKIMSSSVPYCLDLIISTGGIEKISADVKDMTLNSLKRFEKDLECMRNPERPKTVTYSFLKKILPEETIRKMPENINRSVSILMGEESLTEELYKELTDYFHFVFSTVTEKCQDLERKVIRPYRLRDSYLV
jgi:hypothetical protein